MARQTLLVFPVTALLGAVACAAPDAPAPRAPEVSTVIALDSLQFEEPRSQAQWTALRDHLLVAAKGWSYAAPRKSGGSLLEQWCGPAVPADACSTGRVATQTQPGWSYANLSQYFYGDGWPAVFGLAYGAGDLPADGRWGVAITLSLRGRNIGGSAFSLVFRRVRDGATTDRIALGHELAYPVGETRFAVGGPVSDPEAQALAVEASLARYLASPESFREMALARLDALQAEVERGIEAHEATKAVYGATKGGGLPPETTLVPLDAVEETTALSKTVAELGAMRRLVESDAPALYAAMVALLPAGLPVGS